MQTPPYPFSYRKFAESLYAALTADAFYITMERSVPGSSAERREAMLRYFDYSLQEGHRYGRLQFTAEQPIGASVWSRPLDGDRARQVADEKKAFLRKQMGPDSLAAYERITACMGRQTGTVIPPNCWYLSILGIAPAFQGRGLGETLMRPVLEQTDACCRATYLETFTPRNMRFYAKLGYREAGAFEAPGTGARYWVMVRAPAPMGAVENVTGSHRLASIHDQPENHPTGESTC